MEYKQKYLKYKEKYLDLKQGGRIKNRYSNLKKQIGGENEFSLLSFNILNPFEKVANITFSSMIKSIIRKLNVDDGSLISKIRQLIPLDNNMISFISEILAIADQRRYRPIRLTNILNIIEKHLVTKKSIISLQEVNQGTLDSIKEKFSSMAFIVHNVEPDKLIKIFTGYNGKINRNDYSRVEFRVVIIPKEAFDVLESRDFPLSMKDSETEVVKNSVYVRLVDRRTGKQYKVINFHLHYLIKNEMIDEKLVPGITDIIGGEPDIPLIIGGDMNKSLADLGSIIGKFGLNPNGQDESIRTFFEAPVDFPSAPDHILSSNLPGKIEVLTKNDAGKDLVYHLDMINMDIINCLLENFPLFKDKKSFFDRESLKLNDAENAFIERLTAILSSSGNYISDHLPILFTEIPK